MIVTVGNKQRKDVTKVLVLAIIFNSSTAIGYKLVSAILCCQSIVIGIDKSFHEYCQHRCYQNSV